MDLLKIYKIGEHLMSSIPFLGNIHYGLSHRIVNWCKKHNFVRFDNLRAANSTEDDVKRCSSFWFCLASIFVIITIYQAFCLSLSGILFGFFFAFMPYAVGVINLEALKIKSKITDDPLIKTMKEFKDSIDSGDQQSKNLPPKRPLLLRALLLLNEIVIIWLFYIAFWQPEKIQEWVKEYDLYDWVKNLGIKESNIGGVFALCVFLAYIVFSRTVIFLFTLIKWLKKRTVRNYSLEKTQRYISLDQNRRGAKKS